MLVTPHGILRKPFPAGATDATAIARFRSAAAVGLSVDGIVYDSGQFVGPDTLKNYERWAGLRAAEVQLATGVLRRTKSGQSLADVRVWLQSFIVPRVQPNSMSPTNRDWQAEGLLRWATILTITSHTMNEASFLSFVSHAASLPPIIR